MCCHSTRRWHGDARASSGTNHRVSVLRGLSIPETAEALDISPATVKREWQAANRGTRIRELVEQERDEPADDAESNDAESDMVEVGRVRSVPHGVIPHERRAQSMAARSRV